MGFRKTVSGLAEISSIPGITEEIDLIMEKYDLPAKYAMQIDIAIDEILSNICKFAYGSETGEMYVDLEVDEKAKVISLAFSDMGSAFDPLSLEEPDVTLGLEDRKIGGLGIYMVKKSMDSVTYERRDGRNILTISKNYGD